MIDYMQEIEEIHPFIEEHKQITDDNGDQIDIVMHESEEMFFDYDFFVNGEHVDGGRLLTQEPNNVIDVCIAEVKRLNPKQYRTLKQFDEIVDSLINGNFNQAVNQVIEYGFYAQDLRAFVEEKEFNPKYFDNEDFYLVIETATKKRNLTNEE